jgi:methyl-accepting chemotaxis protein
MQPAIEEVVASSGASSEAFDDVASSLTATDEIVKAVQQAMNEEKEGSAHILKTLDVVNKVTSSVESGSKEMRIGNSVILKTVAKLKEASGEISANIEEVASGFDGIETSSQAASGAAANIVEHISSMEKAVGSFRV